MAIVDLILPKLGESIMEATILKWMKNVGDPVKMDESILEIATDKVDSEVPSTAEGTLYEILYNVNDVVPVDSVIARIKTAGGDDAVVLPTQKEEPENLNEEHFEVVSTEIKKPEPSLGNGNARFYSPLVLNIAASEGIGMSELEQIPGTGKEGRVTKNDILEYAAKRGKNIPVSSQLSTPQVIEKQVPVQTQNNEITTYTGNVEIVEMDRMRKLIADHMIRSKQTSAHVTSFSEADVTNMVLWREKVKNEFEKREGAKLTFTPLIIEAIVKCIKKFPLINSSLDGDKIIIKKDINIGMATALPSGNLIVPVIKNAEQLNLVGLTKKVNGLADAARNSKLKADDTQGGTFTFTNVGTFGSLMGTPIINQPQVAIMAAGVIKKRPVVVETPNGDSIAIRHMMYLSMSYDHRIIDGSLGATFVTAVAKELENFEGKDL
ncbi:MAG TPA: dihydrolipoamide acetyltransferase family protein [Niabella sp.]|nr:2-oxo acid dehydrogenase subunit E2 [Chitinophagaceae bacterium]HRO84960.1 dihydrolipoamide acetyltransferase family protein [Niabella sp.]